MPRDPPVMSAILSSRLKRLLRSSLSIDNFAWLRGPEKVLYQLDVNRTQDTRLSINHLHDCTGRQLSKHFKWAGSQVHADLPGPVDVGRFRHTFRSKYDRLANDHCRQGDMGSFVYGLIKKSILLEGRIRIGIETLAGLGAKFSPLDIGLEQVQKLRTKYLDGVVWLLVQPAIVNDIETEKVHHPKRAHWSVLALHPGPVHFFPSGYSVYFQHHARCNQWSQDGVKDIAAIFLLEHERHTLGAL